METLGRYGGGDVVQPRRPRPRHPPLPHRTAVGEGAALRGDRRDRRRPGGSGSGCCRPPTTARAPCVTVAARRARPRSASRSTSSQRQHSVPVRAVRFDGADGPGPRPACSRRSTTAECVVIAPSNPLVSIDPVLAVPASRDAVPPARDRTVAVSPIVAGAALKGPADRLIAELGHSPTVVGVAELYAPLAPTLVIDEADAALAAGGRGRRAACVVAPTVMSHAADRRRRSPTPCSTPAPAPDVRWAARDRRDRGHRRDPRRATTSPA